MIFNVSGGGADNSGGFELISKAELSAAAASVDIPLPTGYSRYRLESFGAVAAKSGTVVISFLKNNAGMTITKHGGLKIVKDLVPDSDGSTDGTITLASRMATVKTVTEVVCGNSNAEIHSAAQCVLSSGEMNIIVTSTKCSDTPDTVRFSSSANISSGATFYLWGIKS